MTAQFNFTVPHRASIEALSKQLTTTLQRPVTTEYGSTDCGQHWAALCTEDSHSVPTAIVTLVIGAGVPGEATVLSRDGVPLREGVTFPAALNTARGVCMKKAPRTAARANATK